MVFLITYIVHLISNHTKKVSKPKPKKVIEPDIETLAYFVLQYGDNWKSAVDKIQADLEKYKHFAYNQDIQIKEMRETHRNEIIWYMQEINRLHTIIELQSKITTKTGS